jgi:hypothetical protein
MRPSIRTLAITNPPASLIHESTSSKRSHNGLIAKTSNASSGRAAWPAQGKSTIAHTITRAYFEQDRLAVSFFSRGGGDAGNASKFVTSIAIQLAVHVPPVQSHICDVIKKRSITASLSLTDQ